MFPESWPVLSDALAAFLGGRWPRAWLLPLLVLIELAYLGMAASLLLGRRGHHADGRSPAPGQLAPSDSARTRRGGRLQARMASRAARGELPPLPALPVVSCIVTCYGEGALVGRTLRSLLDQSWRGPLEVLAVIDGALQNEATLEAASTVRAGPAPGARTLLVIPKWIRGGRASTLNAGLALSQGDLVLALDGDTSFDRDMVTRLVDHFREPGMVAVAGTLRVRNARCNLLTRLQALDYALLRQLVRGGLARLNLVNNIPGAHGAFRRDVLLCAGGWDNGTAEDVDLSLRLRKCLGRYPDWRLGAATDVIGHTDVPEHWGEFLRQRLRWEGDPAFLFLRKHAGSLRPATMGWRNWCFAMWYGLGFQGILPLAYLCAFPLLLSLPWPAAAVALAVAWGMHLTGCALLLLAQVLVVSDRAAEDARLFGLLPLYSWFIFLLRAWSGVAVVHSILARSERDSSMAPWWVLRKSRF